MWYCALYILKFYILLLVFWGYGNFFGFLLIWTRFLISRPGAEAVKALTLATYLLDQYFPSTCLNEVSKGANYENMQSILFRKLYNTVKFSSKALFQHFIFILINLQSCVENISGKTACNKTGCFHGFNSIDHYELFDKGQMDHTT